MPLASLLWYVSQAMEEYDHAESTLRNRTYFNSLGWEIRNFSILVRYRSAGQKLQPVSFTKDSALQSPLENASLSKLQYVISHGDCHLPFVTNTFDIYKSCLFYNFPFTIVIVHNIYNYEYFAFSIFYVTFSATSREVFPTQHTLNYVEKCIEKCQYLLFGRCEFKIKKCYFLFFRTVLYIMNSKFMMIEIMST